MLKIFSFLLIMLTSLPANAELRELHGRVDDIPNGDTIYVVDDKGKRHKVYLLGIEAPQLSQPFGKKSQDQLQHLLFARNDQVKVIIKKRTRAGNLVGTVYAAYQNSKQFADINGMMVMSGFAWANRRTSKQYVAVETIARNRKTGLWKQKKPVAPWNWKGNWKRKKKKK